MNWKSKEHTTLSAQPLAVGKQFRIFSFNDLQHKVYPTSCSNFTLRYGSSVKRQSELLKAFLDVSVTFRARMIEVEHGWCKVYPETFSQIQVSFDRDGVNPKLFLLHGYVKLFCFSPNVECLQAFSLKNLSRYSISATNRILEAGSNPNGRLGVVWRWIASYCSQFTLKHCQPRTISLQ